MTYRVITELIERRALARPEFLVASGYVDSSSGSHIEGWATEAPWAAREAARIAYHDFRSMAAVGEHFFMLHPVGMWNPAPDTDGLGVFDAKLGEAWRPGRYTQRVQLMELYQKAGRRLGPVVDRVDAHSRA